jgi:hypothetical protein
MASAVVAVGVAVLLLANGGLGRVVGAVGSTFGNFFDQLTSTPAPSAGTELPADAPILEGPDEPYTNLATIDLVGRVPDAVVGKANTRIRLYVAIGEQPEAPIGDIPVGTSQRFLVPGVELTEGTNAFTATVIGPTGVESEHSPKVTWILDRTKPRLVLSSPKNDALVNAKSVVIVGQTQARSAMSARNVTTNATVAGAADESGKFSLTLPLGTGTNAITITAVDPAHNENHVDLSVKRGAGVLAASLSTSLYSVMASKLPEEVTLTVIVTDPDGRPLADADVTFTLAIPGIPVITSAPMKTTATGAATFTTTIPKGAATGGATGTAIVSTTQYGQVNDRTVITITK